MLWVNSPVPEDWPGEVECPVNEDEAEAALLVGCLTPVAGGLPAFQLITNHLDYIQTHTDFSTRILEEEKTRTRN